jgi:hypothetical protein
VGYHLSGFGIVQEQKRDFMTMRTIFDEQERDILITRIKQLNGSQKPKWGKMNVFQMIKHCVLWEEMAQGKTVYKRTFLGWLFGKKALPEFIRDEKPFRKFVPTLPELKIKENKGDINELRNNWVSLIQAYKDYNNEFIHPFFGKMTKEQLGYLAYKHNDHHLRQFGV